MTAFGSVVPPHEEQMMTSHLRAQPKLPRRAALTLGLAVALEFQGGHADAKRAWTQTASQMIAMSEAVSRTAVGQPVIRTVGN